MGLKMKEEGPKEPPVNKHKHTDFFAFFCCEEQVLKIRAPKCKECCQFMNLYDHTPEEWEKCVYCRKDDYEGHPPVTLARCYTHKEIDPEIYMCNSCKKNILYME
jgi:hypothetical protein